MDHLPIHPRLKLESFAFFKGIGSDSLQEILGKLRTLSFDPGEFVCREGEPGESLFLIENGLVEVWIEKGGERHLVRRLRQGDVVGEMALLSGEHRSADVVAAVPSTILELDATTFATIVAEHPAVLHNIALLFIQREHASTPVRLRRNRGEAVALIVGRSCVSAVPAVIEAAEQSGIGLPIVVDLGGIVSPGDNRQRRDGVAAVLGQLDDFLHDTERVLVVADESQQELESLLRHMDRVVLMMNRSEAQRWNRSSSSGLAAEIFLIAENRSEIESSSFAHEVVHMSTPALPRRDLLWLGRHLSRTKLGLALGAGGAKGFAHVGAFETLEREGYVFDYVSGSSIGSIFGSCIAMGMSSRVLSDAARWLLSLDVCGSYFRLTTRDAEEPGHIAFYEALSELAAGRSFTDLPLPLALMTADLNARLPFVFRAGLLEEALHAALSIPGLAPPFERENQRLVDGVTIAPVPTQAVKDMGADITVSVNLMSRDELDAWPEDGPITEVQKKRSKTLDPMIETLIMLQLDTSTRNAAEADVVITPEFAPSSWRDIHLADRFEAAGRRAAEGQLSVLKSLANPLSYGIENR